MMSFLAQYGVAITIGALSIIISSCALMYARRRDRRDRERHSLDVEKFLNANEYITLFKNRDAMIKHLLSMYDRAQAGDVIWGQCVSCKNYSVSVRDKVIRAAEKGVQFRIIVNKYAPTKSDLRAIYEPIKSATVVEASDNEISVQGLSGKEVVISLPSTEEYAAILIKNTTICRILRQWFDTRMQEHRG